MSLKQVPPWQGTQDAATVPLVALWLGGLLSDNLIERVHSDSLTEYLREERAYRASRALALRAAESVGENPTLADVTNLFGLVAASVDAGKKRDGAQMRLDGVRDLLYEMTKGYPPYQEPSAGAVGAHTASRGAEPCV